MATQQPLQYSLRSLILLTILIAAAVAVGRDVFSFATDPRGAAHRWSFGPMVGWLALTAILWRRDLGDLLFVRGLLPGLTISILAMVAIGTLVQIPAPGFFEEFPVIAYWSLYLTCLIGECGMLLCSLAVADPRIEDATGQSLNAANIAGATKYPEPKSVDNLDC